jgi:hypothetical protein
MSVDPQDRTLTLILRILISTTGREFAAAVGKTAATFPFRFVGIERLEREFARQLNGPRAAALCPAKVHHG